MKLMFVISEDWYFCSHRKPIAEKALADGWDVHLGCQVDKCRAENPSLTPVFVSQMQ